MCRILQSVEDGLALAGGEVELAVRAGGDVDADDAGDFIAVGLWSD